MAFRRRICVIRDAECVADPAFCKHQSGSEGGILIVRLDYREDDGME